MSNRRSFSNENRLPKWYVKAAKMLQAVKEKKESLNNLIFSQDNTHVQIKSIYGLVTKALQHSEELDKMLKILKDKSDETSHFEEFKARILLTELFWGKLRLPDVPGNNNVKVILANQDRLSSIPINDDSNFKSAMPRYVRINTLFTTKEYVLEHLAQDSWEIVETPITYNRFLKRCAKLSEPNFMVDFHYDDLLVFPAKTPIYRHCLYQSGVFILQAKSSCIPVKILDPKPGDVVMDMCAAPGMKTTQIAAHLENKGVVHAVEVNEKRFNLLEKILHDHGVTCAKTHNSDLLSLKPEDFPDVTHILLDPSCSNSGMDRADVEAKSEEQIRQLSSFQTKSLFHALSFPNVKRIVYSTCSIHSLENEAVIECVMKVNNDKFRVLEDLPMSEDFSRGSDEFEFGKHGVYFHSQKHQTTGFFFCAIERK
ncbi:28S rRNA (cytosine-C(5))-methyltransferase [Neocloeon triangulifer]|uniref:28S rRNA (cytosine-C(5))-methyltransferase n=1 Tax=Neocloeon triangulifer TaxID=2078957 RepID=UPI00286F0A45|nr:28S rRNA (cytosine-C(5))-methyltransferase [Neocloeon triangulifer]